MSDKRKICILLVDDDAVTRTLYKEWLVDADTDIQYEFVEADGGGKGVEACVERKPDCILLDFLMVDKDGFEFLLELKRRSHSLPAIIFLTGYHNRHIEEDALRSGVHSYLNKEGLTAEMLHDAIIRAVGVEERKA